MEEIEDIPFTFVLESDEGAPVPEDMHVTRSGAGFAEFGEIEFSEPGEYLYTIHERDDGVENVIYDDNVYSLDVKVRYDNKGELIATCVAYSENSIGVKEPEILFINTYQEEDPTPISSEDPTPSEEPTPSEDLTPSEEPTPSDENTPSEEPTSIDENTPSEEPTSIDENTPSEEPTSIDESTPSEEPTPSKETDFADANIPSEEPEYVYESNSPEEPTPSATSDSSGFPLTGDNTNIILWIVLLCAAAIGMTICVRHMNMSDKSDKDQTRS
jgi:pilin isopeptide linkage protein